MGLQTGASKPAGLAAGARQTSGARQASQPLAQCVVWHCYLSPQSEPREGCQPKWDSRPDEWRRPRPGERRRKQKHARRSRAAKSLLAAPKNDPDPSKWAGKCERASGTRAETMRALRRLTSWLADRLASWLARSLAGRPADRLASGGRSPMIKIINHHLNVCVCSCPCCLQKPAIWFQAGGRQCRRLRPLRLRSGAGARAEGSGGRALHFGLGGFSQFATPNWAAAAANGLALAPVEGGGLLSSRPQHGRERRSRAGRQSGSQWPERSELALI